MRVRVNLRGRSKGLAAPQVERRRNANEIGQVEREHQPVRDDGQCFAFVEHQQPLDGRHDARLRLARWFQPWKLLSGFSSTSRTAA